MSYVPTPESELTEEEVRKWFNNLRNLYQDALSNIHRRKIERATMNVEICRLKHELFTLRKENNKLKAKTESNKQRTKKENKTEKLKEVKNLDFKRRFLDSL